MAMSIAAAYSYRDDDRVPDFPDDRPLIVFDGVCALCSGFVRFVLRHDPDGRYRFLAAQSDLGAALYRHYGLAADPWDTNLLIQDGRVFTRSTGASEIVRRFGGAWAVIGLLRFLPQRWRDGLYDCVARNRYRWFGRHDLCLIPDAALADRFLS